MAIMQVINSGTLVEGQIDPGWTDRQNLDYTTEVHGFLEGQHRSTRNLF